MKSGGALIVNRLMDTEMDIFLFDIAENIKEKHTRTIRKATLNFKEYKTKDSLIINS